MTITIYDGEPTVSNAVMVYRSVINSARRDDIESHIALAMQGWTTKRDWSTMVPEKTGTSWQGTTESLAYRVKTADGRIVAKGSRTVVRA